MSFLLIALAGCNRDIDNKEAVRQGVLDYLASRSNLNMNSMSVEVASVTFKQNEADAVVAFSPKGSPGGGQSMSMRYTLERKGRRWVVKPHADSGQNPHGTTVGPPAGGAMPPGHPATGGKQ